MQKESSDVDSKSYRQILKSTSIMGGSSIITILLRIIRTKVLAVLIGPTGVGLIGIYDSIAGVMSSVTGMGIGSSGVRQIAEASSTGDRSKISKTIISLRRAAIISGLVGFCLLFFLSGPISRLTFGKTNHENDLAILSVIILLGAISSGQGALIQGMRRLKDLAKLSILGALSGTLLSIPIIYLLGEKGIILFMIIVSATGTFTSWWYSRKIEVLSEAMSLRDTISEVKPLLRLGLAFMSSSLMTAGTFYLLRVFVVRYLGLDAVGVYQAATALSLLYTGFILDAMGRDFYPRLTAVAQDNHECNSLINKQMEVGVLLAVPGIIATMTLAPFVISLFYSSKFLLAVDILRWQILGILLRVITWPMSFIFVAKGNGKLFFWTELFANCMHLGLVWLGIKYFGLTGTGMAFFGMYLFYCLLIYWIVRTSYGFTISPKNIRILAVITLATGIVFLTPYFLEDRLALITNVGVSIAAGLYSMKKLIDIAGTEMIPAFLLRIKAHFGI